MHSPLRSAHIFAFVLFLGHFSSVLPAEEPLDPEHAAKFAAGLKLFNEQVQGVLTARCLDCHNGEDAEGEFDINTREGLLRGGASGKAIILGDAKNSRLMRLIKHELAPEMPFEEQKLTDGEIDAVARWIELGAPYEKSLHGGDKDKPWTEFVIDPAARNYWAFQPLAEVRPPEVQNTAWCRNEIDRFVLSAQEARGLAPNDAAERRVLIRRAYFDLIGLPPSPEEVAAFEQDKEADAFEKVVDGLLASKHYGERWGRHWLDLARFAESHGFEQDYDRPHAFHYRDFVIRALNDDLPYDQFVSWQIAGDEIAPDNPLAMMATGFLGAGVFPTQLTEREFESARYDELDDMVGTLGTAMLGLTIGCARCHDHKFDPIPHADYSRMVAVFATTIRSEVQLDLSTPAELDKAEQQRKLKLAAAQAEIAEFEKDKLPIAFDQFVRSAQKGDFKVTPWTVLDVSSHASAAGTTFEKQSDGSLLKVGRTPAKDTLTLVCRTSQRGISAIRLEALTHASFPHQGPGLAGNGNFCLSDFSVTARRAGSDESSKHVELGEPRATFQQNADTLSAKSSLDSDSSTTGWAVDQGGIGKNQAIIFPFAAPLAVDGETELTVTLRFDHPNSQHAIGRPRLSITSDDPQQVTIHDENEAVPAHVAEMVRQLSRGEPIAEDDRQKAIGWFAARLPEHRRLKAAVEKLLVTSPAQKPVKALICSEGLPKLPHHADGRGFTHFYPKTFYLKRGDVNAKQGESTAAYLQVLMRSKEATTDPLELSGKWMVEPPRGWRTSFRRRSLANWITDTNEGAGALLARVIVNRLWQHHFGRGIVGTPSDFGAQGEKPTHPMLLEYLAKELIAGGWRLKRMHKMMMLSSAYVQSDAVSESNLKIDPDNRFFWRREPRRLEGEVIRDAMLFVAGQLDTTQFGPGTLDESMRRRSIYFTTKRSKLIPMMQIFDQPEPLVSQGDRPATTIAPQALVFMNSPQVRAWSQSFARKLSRFETSLGDAVDQAYQIALSRRPTEAEKKRNVEFLEAQIAAYKAESKPNASELALTDFCQVVLSLNEFVYAK
jgi:hypothetical protein